MIFFYCLKFPTVSYGMTLADTSPASALLERQLLYNIVTLFDTAMDRASRWASLTVLAYCLFYANIIYKQPDPASCFVNGMLGT